jgi:uncharacterized protein YkwD
MSHRFTRSAADIEEMTPLMAMLVAMNMDTLELPPLPVPAPVMMPADGEIAPSAESPSAQKMFDDLNAARRTAGLPELTFDVKLAEIANSYALEMVHNDYVGHTGPDGATLETRFERAAYSFEWAGENIAYAADESDAYSGLWNSPDHRQNMLDAKYEKVGIAAVPAWQGWTIFVEEFSN